MPRVEGGGDRVEKVERVERVEGVEGVEGGIDASGEAQ